jgi:hypothetical protein
MEADMATIDLWEDNAGGLALTDRSRGAGWHGFERGQNERRLRSAPRSEFTLASDAPEFDALGEGGAYEELTRGDVEVLYEREGEANAAVHVASWTDGRIAIHARRSLGAAARWYLADPCQGGARLDGEGGEDCHEVATEERVVEGVVFRLCAAHAAPFDAETRS